MLVEYYKNVYHEPVYDLVTLPNGQQVSNGVLKPAHTDKTSSIQVCTICGTLK